MFNLGFSELLIIGIIALVFIGPRELPEIARVIGRMLNELKRATSDLSQTIIHPKQQLEEELKKSFQNIQQQILDPNHKGDVIPDPAAPPAATPIAEGTKKDEPKS